VGGVGTVTVDGVGSTWTQTNMSFGVGGTGTLNITNGAIASTTNYSNLGQLAGSSGTVNVSGPGSAWNNAAYIRVGVLGSATVNVTNGGVVTGSTVTVGDTAGGSGAVTVDGAGSTFTANNILYVGADGNGSLAITNAGSVVSNIGTLIGDQAGSTGTATVGGTGSNLSTTGDLYVGNAGSGSLALTNGGAVSAADIYVGANSGALGLLTLDGAGSTVTTPGQFEVGITGTGIFAITNGGHATDNFGTIGNSPGTGTGSASVDGVGSIWDNTAALHIGDATTGTLTVTNGGVVNSTDGYLATFSTGNGSANIDGAGSAWNVSGALYVGYAGTGEVLLSNSGVVNVAGGNGTMYLGYSSGSSGQLLIGSGTNSGGVVDAADITTLSGTGNVSFQTNATSASPYYLTKDGTSAGTPVVISGATSVQVLSGYTVLNGNNTYTGGTTLFGGTMVAGSNNALGTGTVIFTTNAATLNVASGVTLNNGLVMPNGGILAGNGTFGTAITAGSGVVLSPGNSPGTLSFASGLTLAGGGGLTFQVQLAGGTAGTGYDLVNVSGGTLNITANNSLPFTITLQSLDGTGAPGNVSDFNATTPYSWTIFTAAGGITGFSASDFVINTSGFTNNPSLSGFFVAQSGNQILLDFAPVPEPSTYALISAGLGLVGFTLRRRRAAAGRS
jgi:T5SS/PEP-CTERM-associated repeat protein